MADLYDVLGVPRGAGDDEIKKAYRRKAREAHPDAGGDEDAFKQIQHAYAVLSDPDRRMRYDRFGDDGTAGARGGAGGFQTGGFGLGDVFEAFFGGSGGFGGAQRQATDRSGRDVLVPYELTLEEVLHGVEAAVPVEVARTCDTCGGSGSQGAGGPVRCATCQGQGQVQRVVRTAFGQLATAAPCGDCGGTGSRVTDPCTGCGGEGRRLQRREVTVKIPPGVDEGDRLKVPGAGEAGRNGGPAGTLYVEMRIAEHDLFERDGRALWAKLSVPFTQAALGAVVTVDTLDGEVEVDVPAGTQPDDVLTVRRRGLPATGGGGRGDLHLRVDVAVPRDLDGEQRDLLEQLAKLRGEDVPGAAGLFGRLKRAFR